MCGIGEAEGFLKSIIEEHLKNCKLLRLYLKSSLTLIDCEIEIFIIADQCENPFLHR